MDNRLPFVSVIIPTYNRAYIIEESIKSILSQTHKYIEVIIVDDQSTDNTKNIIEGINDDRILYHCLEKKLGAAGARQKGIDLAKYDFISFHDSDDIAYDNKIEKELIYLLDNSLDAVACKYEVEDFEKKNIIPDKDISEDDLKINVIIRQNFIGTPLLLLKKDIFEEIAFDSNLPALEDWDLSIKLILNYNVGFLNEVLYTARLQANSITKNTMENYFANVYIFNKYKHLISDRKTFCMQYITLFNQSMYVSSLNYSYFFSVFKYISDIGDFLRSLKMCLLLFVYYIKRVNVARKWRIS